jgi:hypothetical protein
VRHAQARGAALFCLFEFEMAASLVKYIYRVFHFPTQMNFNSYLFNEFVCNLGFFWHEWASLKLE